MTYEYRRDNSTHRCHVCDWRLDRNLITEKERCENPRCQVRQIPFNIEYLAVEVKP